DTWQSLLPDYWIPLLPEQATSGSSSLRLVCYDKEGHSEGRILSEHALGTSLNLFENEVPRMGAHIIRSRQYARWYDGGMFAWVGREKSPGPGEGSSGLRNDVVEVVQTS